MHLASRLGLGRPRRSLSPSSKVIAIRSCLWRWIAPCLRAAGPESIGHVIYLVLRAGLRRLELIGR